MGLIKSADTPVGLAAFSLKDIEAQANSMLLRAKRKAEQIIAAAQTEAVEIHRQAEAQAMAAGHQQGLERGIAEGKKSGHAAALAEHGASLTKLVAALSKASQEIEQNREELRTRGLAEVIGLAGAIARRITKRQGILDPEVLGANLREAMSLAVHAADVRITLHPSQVEKLQAELPGLRLAWPQLKHVQLAEDASIAPGGAKIQCMHGQIDGDLNTQLDRIIGELMPASDAGAV
jgi:flagellar assembly protein FliH